MLLQRTAAELLMRLNMLRMMLPIVVIWMCLGCSDSKQTEIADSPNQDVLPQIPAPVADAENAKISDTNETVAKEDAENSLSDVLDAVEIDASTVSETDVSAPSDTANNDSAVDTVIPDNVDVAEEPADTVELDAGTETETETQDVNDTGDTETTPLTAKSCFEDINDPNKKGPDYDQFEGLIMGSHCNGTNHQDIQGIEKVVVIGDSITQGSPNDIHPACLDTAHFYRNKLSEWLVDEFNLDTGDGFEWGAWKTFDCSYDGSAGKTHSGDFSNCSKWGAKTDDFIDGGEQLPKCFKDFPEFGSDKKTLIFFTIGGNDVGSINKAGFEAAAEEVAAGYPEAWALAKSTIEYLEEAIEWLTNPEHFPNGSYVVFGTPYEFTDSTGNTEACDPEELEIPIIGGTINIKDLGIDLQEIAGFGPWENQEEQFAIVTYLLEEFVRIAVQFQVDVVFMAEAFCGHGWVATGENADTDNVCYRGPDAELWFDKSCYHPSDAGHQALYELFQSVIYQ